MLAKVEHVFFIVLSYPLACCLQNGVAILQICLPSGDDGVLMRKIWSLGIPRQVDEVVFSVFCPTPFLSEQQPASPTLL